MPNYNLSKARSSVEAVTHFYMSEKEAILCNTDEARQQRPSEPFLFRKVVPKNACQCDRDGIIAKLVTVTLATFLAT